MCWVPPFTDIKIITQFPSLYEGISMVCRPVTPEDYGDTVLGVGKKVLDIAAWLLTLEP